MLFRFIEPPAAAVADENTKRFLEGFPDVDLTSGSVRAEILSGGEDALRERLAHQRDIEFRQRKLHVINVQAQINNDPDEAVLDLAIASNIKARQEIAKTIYDQLDDRKRGMGWGEKVLTYGSQLFISPLESYRLHNVVSKDRVTFLPGNNLAEEFDFMWTLPPPEFKRVLSDAANGLSGKNVLTAQKFGAPPLSITSTWNRMIPRIGDLLRLTSTAGSIGRCSVTVRGSLLLLPDGDESFGFE